MNYEWQAHTEIGDVVTRTEQAGMELVGNHAVDKGDCNKYDEGKGGKKAEAPEIAFPS